MRKQPLLRACQWGGLCSAFEAELIMADRASDEATWRGSIGLLVAPLAGEEDGGARQLREQLLPAAARAAAAGQRIRRWQLQGAHCSSPHPSKAHTAMQQSIWNILVASSGAAWTRAALPLIQRGRPAELGWCCACAGAGVGPASKAQRADAQRGVPGHSRGLC